jgi:hypothetical protein
MLPPATFKRQPPKNEFGVSVCFCFEFDVSQAPVSLL